MNHAPDIPFDNLDAATQAALNRVSGARDFFTACVDFAAAIMRIHEMIQAAPAWGAFIQEHDEPRSDLVGTVRGIKARYSRVLEDGVSKLLAGRSPEDEARAVNQLCAQLERDVAQVLLRYAEQSLQDECEDTYPEGEDAEE